MAAVDANDLLKIRCYFEKRLSKHIITQVFRSFEIVCSGNSYSETFQRAFNVDIDLLAIYTHWQGK